jgi:predicted porin
LAALAAAGVASAQSSVTLFGVVDLGYESVKTNAGRISGLAPSANSSSRIGFRGVEDLGGGMSASFWLEAALAPMNGSGSSGTSNDNQNTNLQGTTVGGITFNRRSTVSLSGGFGEVRVGRDYVPTFWNYTLFEPFGTNSVGATMPAYTGDALAKTFVRASNSIGYFLPGNLGGFYGQAMYAFGNRATTETQTGYGVARDSSSNGRYAGVRFGYGQGPINAAVSYGRTTYAAGTRTVAAGALLGLGSFAEGNFTDLSAGASYTMGSIKVMGFGSRQKAADVLAVGNNLTVKGWELGADWGVGAGDVLASYSRASIHAGAKSSKFALGYVHNLSKRTAVYAIGAHVSNKGGAASAAGSYSSGGLSPVTGAANVNGGSNGYDVGIRHSF